MRYTGPKARLCRREGVNLFGSEKYQKILNKRQTLPGFKRPMRVKLSDYGKQLREKQKLKIIYGLNEHQMKNVVKKAERQAGITAFNVMKLLETRMDNVLYRAGFAKTRMQARQFCSHGQFLLNGRRVDIPSIAIKVGDRIELREKLLSSALWGEMEFVAPARWIIADDSSKIIEMKDEPVNDDFEQLVDIQLVLESYFR